MKKVIVSGANSFVGSALVRELLHHEYEIYALVRDGCSSNLPQSERVHFVPCDLAETASLKDRLPKQTYDIFFHFAWAGVAGPARADTQLQLQNAQWTVDSLRAAKELGCGRFLCAGSIMEYEAMAAAYTQGNRPGMGYIYGGGKLAAHVMCMSVAAELGIDLIWPEITNTYGVGEKSQRVVCTTIQKCIRGEAPQFTAGTQNYDFVYIDDVARAFRLIGEKGKPFHEYLIGSSTARPLKEFLLEMQRAIAPELDFQFGDIPFTGIDLPLNKFDCAQTEADTGFRAEISFGEGCRRTMEWWKSMEDRA
ncbi:NAD(P)-dependent oxidoreductase [Pseudoflavonifractor sp. 524-17]|uniref:NAD-dependent epimerase/dehydratase family protein n=1 Tax=Pseudoflavonifractor sp. 524-17 TaxID=2304577 RepID=UPI00137A1611|nr:NAD(P)-dependent oxidoreductase [Pseudoflavonifractor sp. 524-17]NCE65309.1 NAD(P)-dependent oxidoreductase [Pseudoflavonifractor sp. 524-17]